MVVSPTVSLKRRRGDIPPVLEERLMLDIQWIYSTLVDVFYEYIWTRYTKQFEILLVTSCHLIELILKMYVDVVSK